jgi:ABC-type multidrug transport system ATPase subunit
MPVFTVFETIYYNISMQYDLTHEEVERKAMEMITLLGLEKCKDNLVGDSEKKGISGGERKRLSIALELSSNVEMLVLDEPTSGLDTYSALLVMVLLRDLARKGITVVCTVHQPSSEITAMFDNLILLCDG